MANNKKNTNNRGAKGCSNTSKPKDKKFNQNKEEAVKGELPIKQEKKDYNDPAWRQYDALLASQVNSFSMNRIAGTAFTVSSHNATVNFSGPSPVAMGRVVSLNPSAGFALMPTDPINQVALHTYTKISMKNARTINYAPQDITMCMLALNSLLATAASITRVLGVANLSNTMNFTYPRQFMDYGLGVDFADVQANLANYRTQYNILATMAKAISFPGTFKAFDATVAMFSKAFIDHSSPMAQFVVLRPDTYWLLQEDADPKGTRLKTMNYGWDRETTVKLSAVLKIMEDQVRHLMESSTLNFLYSDVLKYVSESGTPMFTMPVVPTDYSVVPEFSDELRLQLENAVIVGKPDTITGTSLYTDQNDVVSDPDRNAVRYNPSFKLRTDSTNQYVDAKVLGTAIVNFHTDNPSVDERTTACRFLSTIRTASVTFNTPNDYRFTAYLSDWYVTEMEDWFIGGNGAACVPVGMAAEPLEHAIWSQFSHPVICVYGKFDGSTANHLKITSNRIFGELDQWCTLDSRTVEMVNKLAIMSLFSLR